MNGLMTQLTRIKPGDQIEEAHMRNRALIAQWTYAHSEGAMALIQKDGKSYLVVNDYVKLRALFATLLAEVQRIKSEGDFDAARQLVETYGVKVDPVLHEEVLRRYAALDLAPYKGFLNPRLSLVYSPNGEITDVEVDYSETYEEQMLRYSRDYASL